jgi:hypothetical protein
LVFAIIQKFCGGRENLDPRCLNHTEILCWSRKF